jgi:uncharacterized protein
MKYEEALDLEIFDLLKGNRALQKLYKDFSYSKEFREHCDAANDLVVKRLGYNDHGIIHAKIVARNALKLYSIFEKRGIKANFVIENDGNLEDVKLILLLSSLLHDIGNSIHRDEHFLHSTHLANDILAAQKMSPRKKLAILECVYAHDESVIATSVEASIVKIADALDMEQGRARMPFSRGNMDIHTVSALAIKKVEIKEGKDRPVSLNILMSCVSGIYQVQEMLLKQIKLGKLENQIDVKVDMTPDSKCGPAIGDLKNIKLG